MAAPESHDRCVCGQEMVTVSDGFTHQQEKEQMGVWRMVEVDGGVLLDSRKRRDF